MLEWRNKSAANWQFNMKKEIRKITRKLKMTKKEKKLIQAINLLLKDIEENAISKEHRCSEIRFDCVECRFKSLEGLLEEYKDIIQI